MQKALLESAFLTVNLSKLIHNASTQLKTADKPNQDTETTPERITDWGAELKKRRDENNAKIAARLPAADIEDAFFQDFLKAHFSEDIAQSIFEFGQLFFRDMQALGFKKENNPILAFLLQSYVQNNLLRPGLLNENTYKVIHNAVAKETVADSEFIETSPDNVIYCKNWYNYSLGDMDAYLKYQNAILSGNAGGYSKKDLITNRKLLIDIGTSGNDLQEIAQNQLKASDSSFADFTSDVKLNSLKLVAEIAKLLGKTPKTAATSKTVEGSLPADLKAFSQRLKQPAQIFVALQNVYMRTGSKAAQAALQNQRFSSLSIPTVATTQISDAMTKLQITSSNAELFVQLLLSRLEEL